jgi:hypothetical protein
VTAHEESPDVPVGSGTETLSPRMWEVRWVAYENYLTFKMCEYAAVGSGRQYFAENERGAILPQPDWEKADRILEGSIKWDGCWNVNFGDEAGYLHLCGDLDVSALRRALRTLHDLAAKHIPAWNDEPVDWSEVNAERADEE